jgi:hypothetical protein
MTAPVGVGLRIIDYWATRCDPPVSDQGIDSLLAYRVGPNRVSLLLSLCTVTSVLVAYTGNEARDELLTASAAMESRHRWPSQGCTCKWPRPNQVQYCSLYVQYQCLGGT